MSNLHSQTGEPGVLIFRDVAVRDAPSSQNAYAYLHIFGGSRQLPSHQIKVFLNSPEINSSTSQANPSFAADFMTYNSPVPPGPAFPARSTSPLAAAQSSPQMLMDISDALSSLGQVSQVDITLLFLGLNGVPIDVGRLVFDDIFITRLTTSKGA